MKLLINSENVDLLPIKHFSVSWLLEYMKNEQSFFKKYIRLEFDNKTGQPLMVGKAYHAALDYYYQNIITPSEIPLEFSPIEFWKINLLNEIKANEDLGIKEFISSKLPKEKIVEFMQILPNTDLEEAPNFEKTFEMFEDLKDRETEFLESCGISQEDINEARKKYIDWGSTQNPTSAIIEVEIALNNYFENEPLFAQVLYSETKETVQICDLDGEILPLGLKGALDLITKNEKGEVIIVDHKAVWKFADMTKGKASYELQAGAYFFIAWAITWERPKAMHFNECLKSEAKIWVWLLKWDLVKLCEENGLDTSWVVDALKTRLIDAWVLKKEPVIKPIIIDFDENPEVVNAFLKVYKIVLNRLALMSLTDSPFEFLPNPFADYSWEESWIDFKLDLDTSKTWKDTLKEKQDSSQEEIREIEL